MFHATWVLYTDALFTIHIGLFGTCSLSSLSSICMPTTKQCSPSSW